MTPEQTINHRVSSLIQNAREFLWNYEFEAAIRTAEQAFDLADMSVHRCDALEIADEATQSMLVHDALAECWRMSSAPNIRQPRRRDGVHEWDASFRAGMEAEDYLDGVFQSRFNVIDPARQSEGIDRLFALQADTRLAFTVDYKADFLARRTWKLGVETVSNV